VKRLFLLVLIASALLLNAARNVTAEGPSQPNQSTQAQTESQQHNPIPSPPVSPLVQPSPAPPAQRREAVTDDQGREASPSGNDLPAWLEAIATILLVGFALWQMRFIRRSTAATENAANAARDNAKAAKDAAIATERYVEMTEQMVKATKQSAHATELALNAERPFVFVEVLTVSAAEAMSYLITGEPAPSDAQVDITVALSLNNQGKGVAVVNSLKVSLIIATSKLLENRTKPVPLYKRRSEQFEYRIISTEQVRQHRAFCTRVSAKIWEDVKRSRLRLLISGVFRYQDVFGRHFWTRYCFEYRPPTGPQTIGSTGLTLPGTPGYLIVGPDGPEEKKTKHNRYK
jgi:hypothetical protein